MKKYVIILGVVLVTVCGFGGYYVWCMYHPNIYIRIIEYKVGENIKIETPMTAFSDRVHNTAESVYQNLRDLTNQHEEMMKYLQDNYKTSDIKLDIVVKNGKTILKYKGNATTKTGKSVTVKKEKICDFALDAEIQR